MLKRESLINEFWARVASATGIIRTARNPVAKPDPSDMPLANLFDFQSKVLKTAGGGKTSLPTLSFETAVHTEVFVAGTSDEEATNELMTVLTAVLASIFSDGSSLWGIDCMVKISEFTRVFRPTVGNFVAAIGVTCYIYYNEDLNDL